MKAVTAERKLTRPQLIKMESGDCGSGNNVQFSSISDPNSEPLPTVQVRLKIWYGSYRLCVTFD